MKLSRYDGSQLRKILIGMVTDKVVCSRISSQWKQEDSIFDHPWAETVGRWCIHHLEKYGEPPNGSIEQIFANWAKTNNPNEDLVDNIEGFLQHLSAEYSEDEPHQSEFVLDIASEYFNRTRVRRTIEEAQDEM